MGEGREFQTEGIVCSKPGSRKVQPAWEAAEQLAIQRQMQRKAEVRGKAGWVGRIYIS